LIGADFDDEVDAVREEWKSYFGSMSPHRGESLDEYLTNYRAVLNRKARARYLSVPLVTFVRATDSVGIIS
jgi:hypothetical protein